MNSSLTIIIPAYNDEATISAVIRESVKAAKRISPSWNIIVLNDASVDHTADILADLQKSIPQLRVMTHKTNKGYGQTMSELYKAAKTSWMVSLPGDFQIHPNQIEILWAQKNTGHMIIGRRIHRNDSFRRRMQSYVYNTLLFLLFGIRLHDVNSIRLMKRSVMQTVTLANTSAFVDAELCIRAIRAGFTIQEIPIAHRARIGVGGGGKLATIGPTVVDMIRFAV